MKKKLGEISRKIEQAARSCGRDPETVRLVAVSKTMPVDRVREAIDAGVAILGENYIQEAGEKFQQLGNDPVSWHFIGHLQTNKAKYAVKIFDLIHTVDSVKLARELNKQAAGTKKIQHILIQVNIGDEAAKSGIPPEETMDLIRTASCFENLSIRGLMIIPPFLDDPEKVRPYFSSCRDLREAIKKDNIPGVSMDELSMGMTGDYEVAIEEGATLVRIGTAIFGKRI